MRHRRESIRKPLLLATLLLLVLMVPTGARAAEQVSGFVSAITLDSDGSFTVTETITYDFADAKRHGMYRTLPLKHPQSGTAWYTERFIDIDDIMVKRDGMTAPVKLSQSRRELELRIGDPEQTLTGEHTYTVSYRVSGGLSVYETEPPELYWNVTGSDWGVPIGAVTTTVTAPPEVLLPARTCYAGVPGSGVAKSETCTETVTEEQVVFTTGRLEPGEELTIAQALNAERIATPVLERVLVWYWLIPFLLVGLALYTHWLYREKTAHRQGGRTVVAQYEPYPDVLPMYAGVLFDGTLHPRDITAGLLYLAQEGFITITKTDRKVLWLFNAEDYQVTRKRSLDEAPTEFHRTILQLLFGSTPHAAASTVSLSKLQRDTTRQRHNQTLLQRLRKAVRNDLVDRGFFERSVPYRIITGVALAVMVVVYIGVAVAGGPEVVALIAAVAVFTIAVVVLQRRRTKRGYEAYYHLAGFKKFLSVTGKDRFTFHNAPEKNPQQFLEYLPYAVAFGVEKEWAAVFADITIPQPEWYHSHAGGAFSATALTSDLDAFASSFSKSSGSSGASGGGSAGGGAGGGGGGSW